MNRITKITLILFSFVVAGKSFSQSTVLMNGKERKVSNSIKEMTKAEETAHNAMYRNKATTCAGAANTGAVVLQDCADVGTAAFYSQGLDVGVANSAATAPTVAEQCAGAVGYTGTGTWIQVNPDPGVDIVDLQITSGSVGSGNHSCWVQFFQGSCAALSAVGCSELVLVTMGLRIPINVHQEGINPSQNLWMYVWDDSGKAFNLNMEVIGSSTSTITNDNCAGASTDDVGCNLGANGDNTWTGPSNNAKVCTGGTWYSNENTVYFSFTASLTTGTINVSGLNCNDGVAGQAQFGVWNNCGCVGTYTAACFRSCAVGTGTLSLSSMTPGQTYIIVVDGQAGDICTWNFSTTGVILPTELLRINAKATDIGNQISWTTASERNSDHFIIERSEDGENYYEIGYLKGAGNKTDATDYSFLDENHPTGTNYYRLIQVDIDGTKQSYIPVSIVNEERGIKVVPNPVSDKAVISFGSNYEGTTKLNVVDISGKIIQTEQVNAIKGTNSVELNTSKLGEGLYILQISNSKENKTIKFTK